MNRSFLIVGIPAVVTSFCWLAFGWGWRVACSVTGAEVVIIAAFVIYVLRKQKHQPSQSEPGR